MRGRGAPKRDGGAFLWETGRLVANLLSLLVFVSGAAGLLYEVVWTRLLVHTLGSTAQAVASVLAAFLGGIAVGAWLLGRRADRAASPLRFYAILEAVIAAYALAFPALNAAFRPVVLTAAGTAYSDALDFVGTFLLLLPATAAMGGTGPVLCRLVIARDRAVGGPAGRIYAWNTLGASIGCLATGFVLIPALGLSATLHLGAAANGAVALAAWVLSRRARPAGAGDAAGKPEKSAAQAAPPSGARAAAKAAKGHPAGAPPAALSPRAMAVVLGAFALSGFVALGYEVLWTRVLVFFVKSVTYGFSLMLATFLAGLVAGSAAIARFADRPGFARAAFPRVELLAGIVAYASIFLLVTRTESLRAIAPAGGGELGVYIPLVFLVVATIFPAGVCFGATFPLAVRLVADRAAGAPGRVGLATAANTAGAIAGAFLAGFVLLPRLGVAGALKVLFVANVAAALALAAVLLAPRARAALLAAGVAALAIVLPGGDFFAKRLGEIRPGRLIFVDEGEDVIVTVHEEEPEGAGEPPVRTIYVNGSSYTGSRFFARRYMKTMGHLPLLLCEERRNALVICLGTGMTLSAVARHEPLERVACAELSAGVERALPLFAAVNEDVARREDVHIEIEDGRHWLQTSGVTWDAITLEPPPPLNAGVGDLYSREFYEICRERLAPGGVLCQWFPMHSQTVEEFRMGLATFADVFPDASLWLPVGRNAVGIGVKEGGAAPWTFERLAARFAEPRIAEAMAAIGYPNPESLLATMILDAEAIARFVGDAPLVTDDRPRLEFHDLRAAAHRFPAGPLLGDLMRARIEPATWLVDRGRGAGIDAAKYGQAATALQHFYRGAFLFEARRTNDAAREWQEALRVDPENAYWRSILRAPATE